MAMTTIRGRYGSWSRDAVPLFIPIVGLQVRFAPAYPFVTNTSATPTPLVIATTPRTFQTDAGGYLSDPDSGFDGNGMGLNRNCLVISSDDPDINPHDWSYLVTFHGTGGTNFRAFRTPAQSDTTVDIAVLSQQRVPVGTAPSAAEVAAAAAAASAAEAAVAVANIRRGQAGGVAPLDADGDVNNAAGQKVLPGGVGGGSPDLANITGMSNIGKQIVATLISGSPASATAIRGVLGAGTGNSNLVIGTTAGTAPDAAVTNTAIGLRALNTQVVHLVGDETVDGTKTFLDPMVIAPAAADDNPVTRAQLNAAVLSGSGSFSGSATINDFLDSPNAADARTAIGAADAVTVAAHTAALAIPPAWISITGKPTVFPAIIGTGPADAKAGDWQPGIADVNGLTEDLSGREGNLVVIYGAASPRVHPSTGSALGLDTVALWVTDGTPAVNAVDGDITLNRSLV